MAGMIQTWEGGIEGDTPSTANSGGASGDPISSVSGLWASTGRYRAASAYASTMGCRIGLGSGGTGAAIWILSATADRYASGIFFRTNLPTGGNDELISLRPLSGSTAGVMITPAGELEISAGGIIGATSGAGLTPGTWYYLEFAIKVSTGAVDLRLYLAGSSTAISTVTLTGQTLSSTSPIGRVIVGRASSRSVIHTLEVDRIVAENLSTGFPARVDLGGVSFDETVALGVNAQLALDAVEVNVVDLPIGVNTQLSFAAVEVNTATVALGVNAALSFSLSNTVVFVETVSLTVNAAMSFGAIETDIATVALSVNTQLSFAAVEVNTATVALGVNAALSFSVVKVAVATVSLGINATPSFTVSMAYLASVQLGINAGLGLALEVEGLDGLYFRGKRYASLYRGLVPVYTT